MAQLGKRNKGPKLDRKGERAAIIEERILDKKDDHKAMPEAGKDERAENLAIYHNYTFHRIKVLLTAGKITEEQGSEFKATHTSITQSVTIARADKNISKDEDAAIRGALDKLNDSINAVVVAAEEGAERTPLLNSMQHRMEEAIESGVKSGRISTLKASSLRRKLARVSDLEERLKKDKEITAKEREKLFEEMNEVRRDLKKELFD